MHACGVKFVCLKELHDSSDSTLQEYYTQL